MTRAAEPEWDDATRSRAEALAMMESGTCSGCGLHSSVLADPEKHRFTFDERTCEVCKAQDIYARVIARRDETARKAVESAPPSIPRPGDGRHIFLRPMTEAEREKVRRDGGSPRKRSG